MNKRILRTIRRLSETYHAFETLNRAQLRPFGLTLAQFDVIATLGNTQGMTFRCLGEATLITKGTLTGVVDRLARNGIVERIGGQVDRRTLVVRLTAEGERLFERVFPLIVGQPLDAGSTLTEADLDRLDAGLARLRKALDDALPLVSKARPDAD